MTTPTPPAWLDRVRAAWRALRGKAYPDDDSPLLRLYPELASLRHVVTVVGGDEGDGEPRATGASQVYSTSVWVYKAVHALATAFAPLPVRVVDADGQPLDGHALTGLLAYVNDHMAPADLWRQWVTDMMLDGEEGWELVRTRGGAYAEIWPRRGERVTVVADKARADYYGVAAYKVRHAADPLKYTLFSPDEFLFTRFYNPANPWRGLAPLAAVRLGVLLDQFAQTWSYQIFRRGGRWEFVLIAPQGLTRSERERYQREFRARYMGDSENIPVFEEGVTDIRPLNWPPKDMEWATQRQFSREEILAVYGVPAELAGVKEATYENRREAYRALWTLTLKPLADFRDGVLTEFFRRVGVLGAEERVATDMSGVRALQEDRGQDLANWATLVDRGVPINTAAAYLGLDLPAIRGGDVGYLPMGMQPVTAAPDAQTQEPPEAAESEAAGAIGKRLVFPPRGSALHAARMKRLADRITPIAEAMKRQLRRDFQRQQNAIARGLRDQAALGLAVRQRLGRGNWRGTGADDAALVAAVKSATAALFDLQAEVDRWEEVYEQYFTVMFETAGSEELARIVAGLDFDMTSPDVRLALAAHLKAFALRTNDTTHAQLIALFQEAEAEGASIADIAERLSAYFGDRKSAYQLERIARTTLSGAQNRASIEAYRQTDGIVQGSQWLSALKGNTRPAHAAAHGQFRPLGQAFDVGGEPLQYPGDPAGSPGNIINCLCAVMPVVAGEEPAPAEAIMPAGAERPLPETLTP